MDEKMKKTRICLLVLSVLFAVGSCQELTPSNREISQQADVAGDTSTASAGTNESTQNFDPVTSERLVNTTSERHNWLNHGRTYAEQRFSPLTQINSENVNELGLVWYYDLNTNNTVEATSLVADGVLYTTDTWSVLYAFDAKTGKLKWRHDPKPDRSWRINACCDVVNRGPAIWQDKVYVGTPDGRLVAVDAQTGEQVWDTLTIDKKFPYTITGAPRVVKGKVLIGNGGAEYGVRGYVSAYDGETGELVWRFYTVPGNPDQGFENPAMEMAAKTWNGEWWKLGGGGTVWDSMAYDPELNLVYIGTGNGSPWNQRLRSPGGGDNLFLSSIVALNADNGEYMWHYQTTPGEAWDFTATQHMILADLVIDRRERKIIMQAPKNGFFYVLDRVTGELLSAEPYGRVNWASHVDMQTGRPVENPGARYKNEPFLGFPGFGGAHNWPPMAYHPETGLVYIPVVDTAFLYTNPDDITRLPGAYNLGVGFRGFLQTNNALEKQGIELSKSYLLAWDPVRQKEVWRVKGKSNTGSSVLATAGNLVFQGSLSGSLNAVSADEGKILWSHNTQTGAFAPPITYSVDGKQYLAIMVGMGNYSRNSSPKNRLLVYALGGNVSLPPTPNPLKPVRIAMDLTDRTEQIEQGKALFHRHCFYCHGIEGMGWGYAPDLRYSSEGIHKNWMNIVLGGALEGAGMIGFSKHLSEEQAKATQAYVVSLNHALIDKE